MDKVAEIIASEFLIDKENSIDKRKLKSDQFGYRSLHYIVSLDKARSQITENKAISTLKAEIQIRSILQHTWAEIEHDLGYKGRSSIPDEYIRSFNRLAALLETADLEFDRLKHDLFESEKNVKDYITQTPQTVELNQASLNSFIQLNEITRNALKIIQANTGATIISDFEFTGLIDRFKRFFNIHNIKELQDRLLSDKNTYYHFVDLFTKGLNHEELSDSLPIYYYQHFLAAKAESIDEMTKYFDFGDSRITKANDAVRHFMNIYIEAKSAANKVFVP